MTATDAGTGLWDIALNPTATPTDDTTREAVLADPGFGRKFTDNMVRAKWTAEQGWHDAELVGYAPLLLDPATNFIHYGQAIFEGLKAYRHADGSIKTFRPFRNAQRFANSARRLAMAELPEELFVGSIEALVRETVIGFRRMRRSLCTCGPSCSPPRSALGSSQRTHTSTC